MLRMSYVILVNILILPGIIQRMRYLVKSEIYEEEKCYSYARWIVRLMHRTGHIKTKGYGMENLPQEGGYMMYPNHQGKYDAYGIVGVHEKPCSVVMDEAKSRGPFISEVIDLLHGKRMSLIDFLALVNELHVDLSFVYDDCRAVEFVARDFRADHNGIIVRKVALSVFGKHYVAIVNVPAKHKADVHSLKFCIHLRIQFSFDIENSALVSFRARLNRANVAHGKENFIFG